jgi:hypothetical protein
MGRGALWVAGAIENREAGGGPDPSASIKAGLTGEKVLF